MAKFNLTINEEICKGCGLCVSVCPKSVLYINKEVANAAGYYPSTVNKQDDCIGCQSCVRMCPEVAIRIEKID